MDGAKPPFQSLTILSAASSALLSLFGLLGVQLDPQLVDQAVSQAAQIASAIMALVAVYGRLRATARIGGHD